MTRVAALILIILGALGAIAFKLSLVDAAYVPLPDGTHPELYGPVSFFRIPVYIACGASVLLGLAIAVRTGSHK